MVLGCFISFIRTLVPIAAGTGRYHRSRFILWNVAGTIAWTLTFMVAGALLDDILSVRDNVEVIAVIIVAFSVLPIAVGLVKKYLDARRCTIKPHNAA